jgi:Zn-finger nucleic acid-binding protein
MASETRAGVTVDLCTDADCCSIWFDAKELDLCWHTIHTESEPPEFRIPDRGLSGRNCPRCDLLMRTAGWPDLVFDRCTRCQGLFVHRRELAILKREGAPVIVSNPIAAFRDLAVEHGLDSFLASNLLLSLLRVFAR